MIERNSIEQLKQIVDIVDIVGSYIELRRAGANYVACCPFHDEKTPSFVVSPSKGYFKCYGCGVGGDSISFIMQKENIEFYEAVEKLAYMVNFTLSYTKQRGDSSLNSLLDKILKYYQKNLNSNKEILQYLANRGITGQSIEKFALGYSGESYDFIAFLNQSKLPFDKLLEIGIIGKNERGYYAKFNSRIMFPIYSPSGKVIGFGGRVLSGDVAKYINSQQSKIFNKSQTLYGYNLAKESIFRDKKIIITEGYIDTIMMSQAGFTNCVATLGTALTKEHLPLLSKSQSEILLCYDGDNAGINAAFKASLLLAGKDGGVVIFKDNKDPADMIRENKIAELMSLLNSPIPFVEFAIEHIASKYNINNPLQKEKALKEIMEFFKTLSPILQDEYRFFITNRLKISPFLLKVKNIQNTTQRFDTSNTQIVESVIIKSILENPNLLDFSLEYINSNVFSFNKYEFDCLVKGDFENEKLIGILIDESILKLDENAFKEQIRVFIITFYTKKINEIKLDKTMDYNNKISIIKDIQDKLRILKSGTLVRVE
ncbi:DNA primase [Helicobacter sp. 16-1353]|uniref:DNA primase n=1 Tax=Helicobacter sp. 16-1353 TaxID=2004996 RepID=UPI000DCCF348|nr:DNA primase [Helicobacter sp. 16-1353]RAX54758.1 DNA primase [Helicobacter sp. 16-1353]